MPHRTWSPRRLGLALAGAHRQLDGGRGFDFVLGFALAAAWLRTSKDRPPAAHPQPES